MEDKKYLTVTALTKYIKYLLENDTHLTKIYLRGEISNLTKHSRGHYYFSLKDESAQIRAIMFSSHTLKLKFSPKEGDKVLVFGNISLYEPSGSYSIQVYDMEPDGIGALYLAYEALKKEFEEKGYFKEERKRMIPKYPKSIGVLTSPTGAAIRDIIHTIERRYPLAKLILYPTLVQGENAKQSIAENIIKANEQSLVDVLIVGRGGGSIEDLWAFNEKEVVEAIYNSKIPIISAVGHETDFTLSDFVSDLRAPTPTAAAELATPDVNVLKREVINTFKNIQNWFKKELNIKQTKLMYLDERLALKHPLKNIQNEKEKYFKLKESLKRNFIWNMELKKREFTSINNYFLRFDLKKLVSYKNELVNDLYNKLNNNLTHLLNSKKQTLSLSLNTLSHLNPLKLMTSGYSITEINQKRVTSIREVNKEDVIETYLKDGKIISKVIKKEKI